MIKTSKEIIDAIIGRVGEDNSDEALSLIEDVTDTLKDFETKSNDTTDWKQKYEDNDKEWREKYKARFLEPAPVVEKFEEPPEQKPILSYDDLFKEK